MKKKNTTNESLTEKSLIKQLDNMIREIGQVPAPDCRVLKIVRKKVLKSKKAIKIVQRYTVQDYLDCLRLSVKYLAFEVEAVGREKQDLINELIDLKGNK